MPVPPGLVQVVGRGARLRVVMASSKQQAAAVAAQGAAVLYSVMLRSHSVLERACRPCAYVCPPPYPTYGTPVHQCL